MKKTLLIYLMVGFAWNALAQQSAEEAMGKLDFLVGNWQGTAQATTGPGQQLNLEQYELVEFRLNGRILLIEGKGYEKGDMVFNALAAVAFDEHKQEYEMTSWLSTGQNAQAYLLVKGENTVEWGFDIPQGGKIKYDISLNDKGQWVETGQYSPDGSQWYPSFNMLLTKK
ncbi:MAG TPA: DUF1579 family protein [Cyclobacteriaceae bacterium]|nr:DUF1579 family protein [Cyclobacteriaceae bacterium]